MTDWEFYEQVAQKVIGDMRITLGVQKVGEKQKLVGIDSATYELDAVAWTNSTGSTDCLPGSKTIFASIFASNMARKMHVT